MSLLGGFLTIFTGVYLPNFNGSDPDGPLDSSGAEYELASIAVPPSLTNREDISFLSIWWRWTPMMMITVRSERKHVGDIFLTNRGQHVIINRCQKEISQPIEN